MAMTTEDKRAYSRKRMKKLREERKAAGLCIQCGSPNDTDRVRCQTCLEKKQNWDEELYLQRKTSRSCVSCGSAVTAKGSAYCKDCRKKMRARYKNAIENGLCPHCFKPKGDTSHRLCPSCLAAERDRYKKRVLVVK